jgi:hypothetical protein
LEKDSLRKIKTTIVLTNSTNPTTNPVHGQWTTVNGQSTPDH